MNRLKTFPKQLVAVALAAAILLLPSPAGAAISQLEIVHTVSGCHMWAAGGRMLGASTTLKLKRGTQALA